MELATWWASDVTPLSTGGGPDARKRMSAAWGVGICRKNPAEGHGNGPGAHDGPSSHVFIGENPLVSDPDLNHTRRAVNLRFLVVQDIFLTETAQLADVVLPQSASPEKEGPFEHRAHGAAVRKPWILPDRHPRTGDYLRQCTRMGYPMS